VTDGAALARAVRATVERFGAIDVAIAHAGINFSKAGVEALTDCLRVETAPSGARVGCAYFGFVDTDLVRASFAHRSTKLMMRGTPSFISCALPLSQAVDAIERGIARRSARVWAPRYVGGAIALPGLLQPLTQMRMMASRRLPRALELAGRAGAGLSDQHAVLDVAVEAGSATDAGDPAEAVVEPPAT
jgi:NAD(P)-dependent dehydrogenase (short-subunit alcohol dehydrogenase family)